MNFNWHLNPHDLVNVEKIVDRAGDLGIQQNFYIDKMKLRMDLTACHNHGCPMDFPKLLAAPDFDFMHDVIGIGNHINRDTGQLMRCFLPRCAKADV